MTDQLDRVFELANECDELKSRIATAIEMLSEVPHMELSSEAVNESHIIWARAVAKNVIALLAKGSDL